MNKTKNIVIAILATVLISTGMVAVTAFGNISEAEEAELNLLEIRKISIPTLENRDVVATIADGFVYYVGQKGVVYQASLDDTTKAKAVYQLPDGNIYAEDGYALAWLTTMDGTAILKYHMGGASMGSDYAVALYSDGSYENWNYSYSSIVRTDDAMVALVSDYKSRAFEIRRTNESTFTSLGEPGYSYGYCIITDGQTTSFVSSSDLAMIGDNVYVLAAKWNAAGENTDLAGIYQVNTKTNETKRVFQESANHFKVVDGYLYFTDYDGLLYKAQIGANQATKVSDVKMNEFFIMGKEIYYTPYRSIDGSVNGTQELYKLGVNEPLVPGSVLNWSAMDANANEGYLSCRLYELDTYSEKYKGMVMDKSGGIVYLESDDIQYITVYDGVIYEVVRGDEGVSTQDVNAEAQQDIKLIIDDQQVNFSQADGLGMPFIEYERTMVPLRKPLEAIGASVSYDAVNRTVIIKKDDTEITVVVDGGMLVNGSAYQVDAPAMIKDERVYVPIRHVFEVLGYSLTWDAETKTVNIKKTGSPIETVKGWSIPFAAVGSTGLGMTDYIGVLTEFPSYSKYNNVISLNNQEQINELNSISVGLRNFSENKPVWLNSLTFGYQVYKKENGKEELVYQEVFSPFEGTLPALSGTSTGMEINYWSAETTAPGEYTIKLVHPEYFTGINKQSNEEIKIPIDVNIFGETVVVNISK